MVTSLFKPKASGVQHHHHHHLSSTTDSRPTSMQYSVSTSPKLLDTESLIGYQTSSLLLDSDNWVYNYLQGASMEIYSAKFSMAFDVTEKEIEEQNRVDNTVLLRKYEQGKESTGVAGTLKNRTLSRRSSLQSAYDTEEHYHDAKSGTQPRRLSDTEIQSRMSVISPANEFDITGKCCKYFVLSDIKMGGLLIQMCIIRILEMAIGHTFL
ncbi:unnamed protein product [Trichobilharzia regenti]|nr:unnamed protein product [Trichobilharzia regenti]